MIRKIFLTRKRFSSNKSLKEDYLNKRSYSDMILDKMFVSHLFPEKEFIWGNNNSHCVAYHPFTKYKVTVLNSSNFSYGKHIYGIKIMPVNDWLVREENGITVFRDSIFSKNIQKVLCNKIDFKESYQNEHLKSDIFSHVRPTGRVVTVLDLNNPPVLDGQLQSSDDNLFFIPFHKGFPSISIDTVDEMAKPDLNKLDKSPVFCKLVKWEYCCHAIGVLLTSPPDNFSQIDSIKTSFRSIDPNGDLKKVVTELLDSYNIKDQPFSDAILSSLSRDLNNIKVTKKDDPNRESFLDKCVLTIDPIDAKDLDDALHIEARPDGYYTVGVHIADVSHFVKPSTALDKEAMSRATSIYLVHKVIPMLPNLLSQDLCSLNPNERKLAISVVFVMDRYGNIISERFTKSVIRPTMRLNYEDASRIIDDDIESLPVKNHPDFELVRKSVQDLNKIAKVLRANRIKNGALILDKLELKFTLNNDLSRFDDRDVEIPASFYVKKHGSSNELIEEFMLLANQAAARLLYNHIKSTPKARKSIGAVLRNHPAPDKSQCDTLKRASKAAGIHMDSIDARVIERHLVELKESDLISARSLSYLCLFNMQVASYLCAEKCLENNKVIVTAGAGSPLYHYGLNAPLYTHFTSPIRRYADLLVHRQVDAIISHKAHCDTDESTRERVVGNCNMKRVASRRLQERLTSVYMAAYLRQEGWRVTEAVILSEKGKLVTALLPHQGLVLRVDLYELAPWACEVRKFSAKDAQMYRLRYSGEKTHYQVTSDEGYDRYEYIADTGHTAPTLAEMDHIDITIFHTFDCLLSSSDGSRLTLQMPYPPTAHTILQDHSRQLTTTQ